MHAALTKKNKIFDSSVVVWFAVCLYTPYIVYLDMPEEKKKKKKEEEEKKEEEQNRNFHIRFWLTVRRTKGTLGLYFI